MFSPPSFAPLRGLWAFSALIAGLALTGHAQLNYATPYSFTTISGVNNLGSSDGAGSAARFSYPQGVATDGSGNIYVSDSRNFTVRKITPAGVVTTFAGSAGQAGSADGTGSAARFTGTTGIGVDAAGNVYVNSGTAVRKITAGVVVTTLAGNPDEHGSNDGTGSAARFSSLADLAVDAGGTVYVADSFNNTIRKITPAGVVTTFAGLAGAAGSADGNGATARFNRPQGVAVDGNGTVYVSDQDNSTIRKITSDGTVLTLAGSAGASGSADGTGTSARFYGPSGLSVDSSGNVWVADAGNQVIRKITPAGTVTTVAGRLRSVGSTDGNGTSASFYNPQDVAADGSGNLYVADNYNHTIRKISVSLDVSTLAGTGRESVKGVVNGPLGTARFASLYSIVIGSDRTLYLTDGNTVRKVSPDGIVSTLAGTSGALGDADGTGSSASFYSIESIVVDSAGTVYAADTINHTIRKITPAGVVSTLAGAARTAGTSDGTGSAARFNRPHGLAFDGAGNLIVADYLNGAVRKVTPAGVVTTVAGVVGQPGAANGAAGNARFAAPFAVAVDPAGNILVADSQCIRKIAPDGNVTTFAGELLPPNTGSGAPLTDGFGTSARFGQIKNLAVDKSGSIFVAGWFSGLVRKVSPEGNVTTLAGGDPYQESGNRDGTGRDARFDEVTGIAVDPNGTLFVTSSSAIHKGRVPGPPVINAQPQNLTVTAGSGVQFAVTADSVPDPTYQWNFNGGAFSGGTGSTLAFANARSTDAGEYTVVVTNPFGSVTSAKATLTVNAVVAPPPATGGGSSGGSGGGGGGGGAPSAWFLLALLTLAALRAPRGHHSGG